MKQTPFFSFVLSCSIAWCVALSATHSTYALPKGNTKAKVVSATKSAPTVKNNLSSERIPADVQATITEEKAKAHLSWLASDELRGRNTPSPELERAGQYIADKFKAWGLVPVKDNSYFQYYDLERRNLGDGNRVVLNLPGGAKELQLKDDYIPYPFSGGGSLTGVGVVFVGFGITAPEFKYDDYAGIDVKGKIVVVMRGEPQMANPNDALFDGARLSSHSAIATKMANAIKHGAVGMIRVGDPVTTKRIAPVGFSWPRIFKNIPESALPLTLPKDNAVKPIIALDGGESVITALFGSMDALKVIQQSIDSTLKPQSKDLNIRADVTINMIEEKIKVRNIVGMVKGSQKPDEYVVLGAHYDHVGFSTPNAPQQDSIYNGADDNGSGTTGLLLNAEAFGTAKVKPSRSMIFVAFSGEEKGLYGSRAFVKYSPVSTDKIVAMLNTDMIGRNDIDSLSAGGNTRCKELADLSAEENATFAKPFSLKYNIEEFFFRSDQASFAMRKIPVIFYFSGMHEDYHRPGDEVSKINFPKLTQVAQLCTRTAWRVSMLPGRLPYTPVPTDDPSLLD